MVNRLLNIAEAISILAGSPESQIEYLQKIGLMKPNDVVDDKFDISELALQFEDANYGIHDISDFSGEILESIGNLRDALLKEAGKQEDQFWTINGLKSDVRWSRIRELAFDCLSKIDQSIIRN